MTLILKEDEFNNIFKIKKEIFAYGSYGNIKETICNKYIVKETEQYIESIFCELDILSRINSPYIIKPIAMCFAKNLIKIVYEKGVVINKYVMDPDNAVQIFYDLLFGLKILHENNIAHCDIKPPNIIILNDKPVFIDFGISKFCYKLENNNDKAFICKTAYTTGFEPPEIGQEATRSITGDIYSLGKTFMCISDNIDFIYSNKVKKYADPNMFELISSMVTTIENRKSIDELLNLNFFKNIKKNDIDYLLNQNHQNQNQIQINKKKIMPIKFYENLYTLIHDMNAYDIETYIIFQCIHNIHRSSDILNDDNIMVVFYANFYLSAYKSIFYENIYNNLTSFIKIFKLACTEKNFIEMVLILLEKFNCMITTNTIWNDCKVDESMYKYFKLICNWNYPYVSCSDNLNKYLKNNNYNNCFAILDICKSINSYQEFMDFVKKDCIYLTDYYRIIPKTMKNITPSIERLYSAVSSIITNDNILEMHHCIYGLIYRAFEHHGGVTLFSNTVFNKIIKSKYYDLYDTIFSINKLKIGRKYKALDYTKFIINIFLCTSVEFNNYITNQN